MLAMDWTKRSAAFFMASICFRSDSSAMYWSFHSGITEKKNLFSNFIVAEATRERYGRRNTNDTVFVFRPSSGKNPLFISQKTERGKMARSLNTIAVKVGELR